MLTKFKSTAAALMILAMAGSASAQDWTLDGAASHLAFGSIKRDTAGEAHSFERLSGMVSADGMAKIDIDLASVQTNIDVRNERMNEHVFKGMTSASIAAELDMETMSALAVGASLVEEVDVTLSFLGQDVELYTNLFVMRLSESKVMVSSNDMLFVSSEDLGIDTGLDKLMELASLPGITRAVPVTLRFMFDMKM